MQALAWLSIKQRCAQEALKPQLAGMDASAASAYVHGWLSEWMSPTWSRRLATHLGIETGEADSGMRSQGTVC